MPIARPASGLMNDADDGEIVELVLRGNRDAFGILVRRYQGSIYNLMYRMCRSSEDAADLAQEAFIKAYEKLETFKTDKRFFPWLYAIGLNHARDYSRKRKLITGLTDEEMETLAIQKHATCPNWNYTIRPREPETYS